MVFREIALDGLVIDYSNTCLTMGNRVQGNQQLQQAVEPLKSVYGVEDAVG